MSDGKLPTERGFGQKTRKADGVRNSNDSDKRGTASAVTRRKVLLATGALGVAGGAGFGAGIAAGRDFEELCEAVPNDVVLVIDRSGSMRGDPDGDGNTKLDDVKRAATGFVNRLTDNDHVGLVSFNESASLDEQLTSDHSNVETAINGLSAGGSTNIGQAVDTAHGELTSSRDRPDANDVMVLLSNGLPNRGTDPEDEADEAKNDGIRLITIAFGEDADDSLMQRMASDPTSDNFFDAPTGADIDNVFETISQEICPLVVELDIKPGSDPNSINCGSNGVVPVAVLTTDDFDAMTVDPASLRFGSPEAVVNGDGAALAHGDGHIEDADGDGDADHVGHYPTQETGFAKSDDEGWLVGKTEDGRDIAGRDSVKIVGKCD